VQQFVALRLPPHYWQAGLRCSDLRALNLNVTSPAPMTSAPCVRGRASPAIRPSLGERLWRDSEAAAPTASPPDAQQARLEDAGDAEPEPQLRARLQDAGIVGPKHHVAPCYVFGRTH
jgi:hypothetical protein